MTKKISKTPVYIVVGFFLLMYMLNTIKYSNNNSFNLRDKIIKQPLPPSSSPPTIKINKSSIKQPVFTKIKTPLDKITCVEGYEFYMHFTGIETWVCDTIYEQRVTYIMTKILEVADKGSVMLDIGSNAGFYGLLAMKMGFYSIMFDLQPGCQEMINNAIISNQLQDMGVVIPYGVSSKKESFRMSDSGSCDGRFPASARKAHKFNIGKITINLDKLSTYFYPDQPVTFMKVDTEGNEQKVLEGAIEFFEKRNIKNAIVEITPGAGFWENAGITRREVADTMVKIAKSGYTFVTLFDSKIYKTPEEVESLIINANFKQTDVWITLEPMNVINERLVDLP